FPTAFTVLVAVLFLVWIAAFFVPAGVYKTDAAGSPVPGTYHKLSSCTPATARTPRTPLRADTRRGRSTVTETPAPPAAPPPGALCVNTSFTYRFKQLWNSPPNGLYGVEGASGTVGPWEEGFLYGSAAIFLFVL